MNILLTGGAGYIGSHTAVELLNEGHEVVIVDNLINSKIEAINRIEKVAGKKAAFIRGDVADANLLSTVFTTHSIDAVIHFAGLKAVGESVKMPLTYYRNNIDSTLTLLEVMKEHGCHRIIFSSSATVYGDPASVPINEDMPVGSCSNPYGRTKYMIEEILKDAAYADTSLSVVLLRYFNPIGAHKSGLLCEDPNGIPNNLMPYILKVVSGKADNLKVFGNDYPTPDGTGVRDYIHVEDLARGHVAAVNYSVSHTGVEAVNLGTGNGYSVLDVIHSFEEANHIKVPYVITERRPGDIAVCYASPKKAEEIFGWKAQKDLTDMCRDSFHAVQQNPNGYENSR